LEDLRNFTDRQKAIDAFDALWNPGNGWIMAFNGFSGLGKTTLLDWLQVNRCGRDKIPYARCSLGDGIEDISACLTFLIDQLRTLLPRRAYQEYHQAHIAIQQRLEQVPITIKQNMNIEDSEQASQSQVASVEELVATYERSASHELAEHWLSAMNEIHTVPRIVFLIDNYDFFQQRTDRKDIAFFWSVMERAFLVLPGLRIVLASREKIIFANQIQALQTEIGRAHV
jgi:hypothetical protein